MTRLVWAISLTLGAAGLVILTITPDGLNPLVGWALILAATGIAAAIPVPTRQAPARPVRHLTDRRDIDLEFRKITAHLEDTP